MDEFLETVLMYKTVHRPVITSYWRTLEEIWNIGSQIELCCVVHHTGSMFEGMPDEACGDQDRLLVRPGFPEVIFEPIGVKENILSNVVIAYNDTENPAYVLLKAVNVETLPQTVKDAVNDKGFVQSARLIEIMKQDTEQVHGPSLTALLYSSIPEIGPVDHVMCFSCPSWPPCAMDFLTRTSSRWPSGSLKKGITSNGCHVVPVGNPQSTNKEIEWRWSFSVAERELVHHMNHSMYACLFALKAIVKVHWKEDESSTTKPLCSYFLKTVCFWVCEEHSGEEKRIMNLIFIVLDRLINCYHVRFLPNYFIPEQNLLNHLDQEMCINVYEWLTVVKYNFAEKFLSSINPSGYLLDVFEELGENLGVTDMQPQPNDNDRDDERLDFSLLLNVLGKSENKEVLLDGMGDKIKPNSPYYKEYKRYGLGEYSTFSDDFIFQALNDNLKNPFQHYLVSLPENALMPVIEDIEDIVMSQDHSAMFRQSLYRHLGDCYHALASYFKTEMNIELHQTCNEKAVNFYTVGKVMTHPDGWTDKGLVGLVLLAKFYYLNEQQEALSSVLNDLQPLLDEAADSNDKRLGMSDIVIVLSPLGTWPWKRDHELYSMLISRYRYVTIEMNPLILGYYIICRYTAEKNEVIKAKAAIDQMDKCWVKLWGGDAKDACEIMIKVARSYLESIDTQVICNNSP